MARIMTNFTAADMLGTPPAPVAKTEVAPKKAAPKASKGKKEASQEGSKTLLEGTMPDYVAEED
jgi:hypothetical protein